MNNSRNSNSSRKKAVHGQDRLVALDSHRTDISIRNKGKETSTHHGRDQERCWPQQYSDWWSIMQWRTGKRVAIIHYKTG